MKCCLDVWYIIYNYLDPSNKWDLSHVCKDFISIVSRERQIVERLLQSKHPFYSYDYDSTYKSFYFYTRQKFEQLFCVNKRYDHLLIDHFVANKCYINDFQAIISVFDSVGSQVLRLVVNDRSCEYTESEYTISSCIYHNVGLYEREMSNRYEYFLNGQFIGYNYFINYENEQREKEEEEEIKIGKEIDKIRCEINKLILIDQIFPDIYQMIINQPFEDYQIKFIKKSKMVLDNKLFKFLDSLLCTKKQNKIKIIINGQKTKNNCGKTYTLKWDYDFSMH